MTPTPVCSLCYRPITTLRASIVFTSQCDPIPADGPRFHVYTLADLDDPVISRQWAEREAKQRAATTTDYHFEHDDCPGTGVYGVNLRRLRTEGLLHWFAHLHRKLWWTPNASHGLLQAAVLAKRLPLTPKRRAGAGAA